MELPVNGISGCGLQWPLTGPFLTLAACLASGIMPVMLGSSAGLEPETWPLELVCTRRAVTHQAVSIGKSRAPWATKGFNCVEAGQQPASVQKSRGRTRASLHCNVRSKTEAVRHQTCETAREQTRGYSKILGSQLARVDPAGSRRTGAT